jgi:hypothetical protein
VLKRAVVLSVVVLVACASPVPPGASDVCSGPGDVREASQASIADFIQGEGKTVLTFAGYSGAGYEDADAMLARASSILEAQDPEKAMINIGATSAGIGAVYELAKKKGFTTMGIVSTLARDERVELSKCVDHVFYVRDDTWGGRAPGGDELSPTSAAIVALSSSFVAIGGGDVTRDEMVAARRAGKPVTFVPADLSHEIAREKARKKGEPEPGDFRGSAHAALAETLP